MQIYSYRTIKAPSEGSYKEKGSRFLSFAYPVDTDGAVRLRVDQIKREYFDARHHCYAWMLGPDKKQFKAVDDGEPSHSAGDPILGQIRSNDLTQILVIVVRYFGGIKLGVGGLIQAYREAAADAIRNAVIIEEEVVVNATLVYPFDKTADVMRMLKDFRIQLIEQSYNTHCALTIQVPVRNRVALLGRIDQLNIPQPSIAYSEG